MEVEELSREIITGCEQIRGHGEDAGPDAENMKEMVRSERLTYPDRLERDTETETHV